MIRKITIKQREAFKKRCEDYLKSIAAMKADKLDHHDWMLISIYGNLKISISPSETLFNIYMRVEHPEFVPSEENWITKPSGKCNIQMTGGDNNKELADESFNCFKRFIERIKSPVHNENHILTNT